MLREKMRESLEQQGDGECVGSSLKINLIKRSKKYYFRKIEIALRELP